MVFARMVLVLLLCLKPLSQDDVLLQDRIRFWGLVVYSEDL